VLALGEILVGIQKVAHTDLDFNRRRFLPPPEVVPSTRSPGCSR
jgi:hypothetical protein